MSFVDLRLRKRTDEEAVGHGAWEVIRDSRGMIRRLEHVPGHTVLPLRGDGEEMIVERDEWVSTIETRRVTETVKFRRYVQRTGNKTVYFKDLGDPRLVSQDSGKIYMKEVRILEARRLVPDEILMRKEEPKASPAKELIYFDVYSPETTAGMIRWAGVLVAVLGNQAAAAANLAYFENHAIPDAMLLISGGQLNNESVERIEESLRAKARGAQNHHRCIVVQATAKGTRPNEVTNNPDMEWVNLADFQQGDALFLNYMKSNKTDIGSAFRQALMMIGHIPSDLNRATAFAILSLIEKQVYGPLRRKFDWWMNNVLLPAIGIKLLKFESLSPEATNIEEMSKALEEGNKGGAFTPNSLRELYGKWLNVEFPRIDEPWGDQPFAATLNKMELGNVPPSASRGGDEGVSTDEPKPDEGGDENVGKSLNNRVSELEQLVARLHETMRNEGDFALSIRDVG